MTTGPSAATHPSDADEELWLYEGLRIGSTTAMRRLLDAHHADMVRTAALFAPDDPAPLVARAWTVALGGLSTFVWHTSFRAWLFGILIDAGRASSPLSVGEEPAGRLLAERGRVTTRDPASAAELPWTAWWTPDSWARMAAWLASRPGVEREAVLLIDMLGWSPEEARDALGWTDAHLAGLHHGVRTELADRLRAESGLAPDVVDADGVGGLLAQLPGPDAAVATEPLVVQFRRWRSDRGLTLPKRLAGRIARRRRVARRATAHALSVAR